MENDKSLRDNSNEIKILQKRSEHLSRRLELFKIHWVGIILSGIIGIAIMSIADPFHILTYTDNTEKISSFKIFMSLISGFGLGIGMYLYLLIPLKFITESALRRIGYELIRKGAGELQNSIEEDFFTKIVKINFKYLDQYYLQTKDQANKGFYISASAAVMGLIIIFIGIILMFNDKTTPAYLTTATGVVSEFISAVFFYLYNKTVIKMSEYHKKLVLSQNVALALKISDSLPENDSVEAKKVLIHQLTNEINKYFVG